MLYAFQLRILALKMELSQFLCMLYLLYRDVDALGEYLRTKL